MRRIGLLCIAFAAGLLAWQGVWAKISGTWYPMVLRDLLNSDLDRLISSLAFGKRFLNVHPSIVLVLLGATIMMISDQQTRRARRAAPILNQRLPGEM